MERLISLVGLFAMVGCAWLMSSHRSRVSWRVVVGGMILQFVLGLLVLKTTGGRMLFEHAGNTFNSLLDCVDEGSKTVFGMPLYAEQQDGGFAPTADGQRTPTSVAISGFEDHYVAFKVLPTIIFFSSFMSILYYLGIVQIVVSGVAWVMQRTLGTSGAESLSAAANIFVGQTEAPLVIKPYISAMTMSELMSIMVGGFATIAGGVLALYIGFGIDASHLITASVMSAPAALLIAKVLQPEVDEPVTLGSVTMSVERTEANIIEAAGNGAIDGLKLALNVGAMLIAFIAIMAVLNSLVAWFGGLLGYEEVWRLEQIIGLLFWPFAWLMGIPASECFLAGELLGTKIVLNELVAFSSLANIASADAAAADGNVQLSERSVTILTYALCGFANFSSIGIQLGGIGAIAPDRRTDLAKLGFRAMLGGTLAAFMTACVAGILL